MMPLCGILCKSCHLANSRVLAVLEFSSCLASLLLDGREATLVTFLDMDSRLLFHRLCLGFDWMNLRQMS